MGVNEIERMSASIPVTVDEVKDRSLMMEMAGSWRIIWIPFPNVFRL